MSKCLSVALFFGLVCLLVGCADAVKKPPAGKTVKGTVTLDGANLKKGQITFEDQDNQGFIPAVLEITDGSFSGPVRPGKMKVKISSMEDTGKKEGTGQPLLEEKIPEKYNSKTELEAKIGPDGESALKFELKTK